MSKHTPMNTPIQLNSRETAMLLIRAELLTGALEDAARTKAYYLELRDSAYKAQDVKESDELQTQLQYTRNHLKLQQNNISQQRIKMRELLTELESSREAGSEANPSSNTFLNNDATSISENNISESNISETK